ncbi:hypothetical protein EDD11_006330 [Mortierella claussenii]|nr:hypothetical protein EDD11_006330 [Mortierella claussenii]
MPVFTPICSTAPAQESIAALVTCTCPCGMLMDVDHMTHGKDTQAQLFIHIDGVSHLVTCALNTSALNSNTNRNNAGNISSKDGMVLLKQQQQQKLIGGLALLRKPPVQMAHRRSDPFAPLRLQPVRTSHLYAGSQFRGKQKSGGTSYDVMVDIKDVRLEDSSLCGYLHINGLTEEYPELTTFFDAEIIGGVHSFVTKKWEADIKTDKEHWKQFDPFASMINHFADEKFKYDFKDKDVIFMRWKEHFLVPDHHVRGIHGASFAGFYYICYNRATGEIDGYYFHKSSAKFQKLMLKHVAEQPSSFGSFEFR